MNGSKLLCVLVLFQRPDFSGLLNEEAPLTTLATSADKQIQLQEVGKQLTPHHPLMLGQKPFLLFELKRLSKETKMHYLMMCMK
ncbi:hypothetical protein ACMXYV_13660 [Neptuniibacter sp. SY11_33]|uniref:hypothetical protein n=1 Tax=Neptuniibacter sp. SY11_33 TaxID=3398215 RepID=UPI0039F56547